MHNELLHVNMNARIDAQVSIFPSCIVYVYLIISYPEEE